MGFVTFGRGGGGVPQHQDRTYWLQTMLKIAEPVLANLAEGRLAASLPAEGPPDRQLYAPLEAFARTLAGIAPWLESGTEDALRGRFARLSREGLDRATHPDSPDRMNFGEGGQPIVDAAFLAQAILRAPAELWAKLPERVRGQVARALKATRSRKPCFNNWLLFSALIEAALRRMGEDWDPMRVDYALRQHEQWYVGDGAYGDGPHFHRDYYNSFVIHPMLIDLLAEVGAEDPEWEAMKEPVLRRARRYAEVLERLISPEGAFPPVGRSLAYRFGVFHLPAQLALLRQLPASLPAPQVRSALTAVIRNMIEPEGTFDDGGWLRIGFRGHQPWIGEPYVSTGSLYLCTVVFLPLGLDPSDPFWSGEPTDWTAKRIWSGGQAGIDKALVE
jgi:hypothetical protein